MKFKFNKFCIKKFISVFAAIAILMTSLPMSAFFTTVGAVSNSDKIDFEGSDASAIVEGNDAFSITGQDSQDKYYFYAKNKTSDILTITFDNIQLNAGKQYTLDFDVYTLRVSKDDNDVLLGLKMYGDSECLFEKQIKNTDICEEDWANYHTSFTAKVGVNKLDFSIHTIGKVIIDNFVLIDENGKETDIDVVAACDATELKDHFSMATLYDIAYEEPDIIDGYLKAAVPVNSRIDYNEGVDIPMNLDKPLDKGRYTVSVDLKFTSVGSCRTSFCASVAGADYGIIQQKFLDNYDITLNKYNTYTFELDLTPEHTYFRLNVYQGCTAYIDNLALIDPAGIEVVRFDFDEPVNFNGSAYEQKGIAKTKAASAALYSKMVVATAAEGSDNYAVLVDNSAGTGYDSFWMTALGYESPNLPSGEKYTISFDWYAEKVGSTNNGSLRVGKAHWNTTTVIQENDTVWFDLPTETGSWVTITKEVTATDIIGAPYIYVGAGVKGYLDNFKITDSDGTVHSNVEFTANDLSKNSNCATVAALPQDIANKRVPAYKMVFDVNEIFRTADTSCSESIKVTFDYYLASGAITTNSANTGDNDLFKSSLELGTHSFEFNAGSETKSFKLTATEASELYIWNVKVVTDGTEQKFANRTDRTTCEFSEITYADIPFASDDVEVSPDYAILIDNSANDGFGQFYLHDLGMPYDAVYPIGDYTIKFDFYPIEIGSNKNIVSHITSPGWNGNAFPGTDGQKWTEISETIGEWQTISFDITTIAEGQFPWFYIGAGMKGYFDNYQIIDKATGNTLLDFSPVAADLGKTSKEIATVVELPKEDEEDNAEISSNDVLLIDTTTVADDGSANKSFWFNELGMKGYGTLPNGTYTVKFDVCPITLAQSGTKFHFRTSNGQAEGAWAGFWKPDLTVGEWTTTSSTFTVTDETTSGNHILFVYGGFKGYIDNLVVLDSNGNEVTGTYTDMTGLTVPDQYKDYLKIETITPVVDDEETETNDVLLVDTTAVADDGNDNKSFWFNELGMAGYGTLPNGTYTVKFDVCPITLAQSGTKFHFRTSNGRAEGAWAGFWKPELTVGEWTTTSSTFTVTDQTTSGNHILFVYGGFKGYIDNLVVLDSNGNAVAGTYTDMSGLTVPDQYKDYLKLETLTSKDDEEAETNDVLLIDTTANDNNTPKDFWFNTLGMSGYGTLPNGTYTIQFDVYPLIMPTGGNLFHFRTGSGSGPSSDTGWWKPNLATEQWTTTSSMFTVTDDTTTGNHILYVYGGFKGYVDNFVILDASGNEVSGTYTDMTGLTVPDQYKDYLKIEKVTISDGSDDTEDVLSSGMNIAILRGRAGKNGASIKLGGAKSPLTIKSNTTYKLSFRYYQANPTNSGVLNLFGIDTGFDNEITYFKKNNTTGWATGSVYFTTGEVTDAAVDWFEIVLNPNAWVYFDSFKLTEQEVDNNKEVSVIDFEEKDDSIYPDLVADNCTFGQTTDFDGVSNGGNGYFCASNAREYTNDDKNSNQDYTFGGIKLKSNTTYQVSIDYYVAKQINDYAFAIRYNQTNIGSGSGYGVGIWGNNKKVIGWNTESFVFTTGDVVPNAGYINIVIYDTPDSSNPRVMYFDNITFTELYRIDSTSNNSELGTVSSTRTVEAGSDCKVVANPYAGVTFEGWYEYGDLVSTDETYRIKNVNDNHKLVAYFSGTPVKPDRIVQGFEDYDLGDILYEYYEIVDDPKNVLEGKQSLHVKDDKIEVNADHSIFFPLVSNVETQLKEDTEYDVYVWIKPTHEPESTTYFQIVHSTGIADMSDLLTSPGGTGMQRGIKPVKAAADGEENGWYRFLIGTVTKSMATRQGYGIQICKFHAFRQEGASIDDMYIDMVELVERVPDYANLKFTESLFNEISNSNFENEITNENWAPLTAGVTVEKVTDKQYDWQGNYNLKFDAAKSNGEEYIRIIPIAKKDKNYTFAAWTKLSEGSDISVGLYKNGNYETFENVVNGENGTLGLIDDGKWNRVSFTFNSGDSENAYLVIRGTKGTLEIDMIDLFIATRAYTTDPNSYGTNNTVLQMTNPIAFPDIIRTETTYIESDDDDIQEDTQDDTYIEENKDEEDTDDEKPENNKKKKKKRVVKVVKSGGTSPWVWAGIGAGALVVAAAATIFVILFKKRKLTKKGAK